jgi:hypothetical protein
VQVPLQEKLPVLQQLVQLQVPLQEKLPVLQQDLEV